MIEFGITTPMLVRFSASTCLMIGVITCAFLGLRWVGRQVATHNNNDPLSHEARGKLEFN